MELKFETTRTVTNGEYPDLIHFETEEAQVFDIQGGRLFAKSTDKIKMGDWEKYLEVNEPLDVSPDDNMEGLEINTLSGFGIVGGYKVDTPIVDTHKLLIYEFAHELDKYLVSGKITQSLDNPIDGFDLTLSNPDIKNPERPGNYVINENNSIALPGSKIEFKFGLGTSVEPDFDMGQFYIDSSGYTQLTENAEVNGRNLIGKALRDQTVDENNYFENEFLHETLAKLLREANLTNDQYIIQPSSYNGGWAMDPNTTVMAAIESLLSVGEPGWIMRQLADGTIVIGNPTYTWFDNPGTHRFERSKDVFSRSISYDDANSYSKVCVHDRNFEVAEYSKVEGFSGWNLQANRTLYVNMPDGVLSSEAKDYADELARQLKRAGKLETFTGPFKPYIQPGDGAIIDSESGYQELGLITDITHTFGRSGFSTKFTVDSGGTVGNGRISDYINKIVGSKGGSPRAGIEAIK